jgi:hypothetical protein
MPWEWRMSRKVSVASFIEDNITGTSRKIVSTSEMIHAVRSAFPACEHTNDELAQLIAMLAIRMGRNVNFNRVAEVANDDIRLPSESAGQTAISGGTSHLLAECDPELQRVAVTLR